MSIVRTDTCSGELESMTLHHSLACTAVRAGRHDLRGALLGLEIGTGQSTLPVVVGRFGSTPHIVLSGAFLALGASDCNGWPRRWVSGQRRDWYPGRTQTQG